MNVNQFTQGGWVLDLHLTGFDDLPPGPCLLACGILRDFEIPFPFRALDELFRPRRITSPGIGFCEIDRAPLKFRAARTVLRRLQTGGSVAILPKAERPDAERMPFLSGIAALARIARCPIRTCLIVGNGRLGSWKAWLRRPRIDVVSGCEFHPDRALPPRAAQRTLAALLEADFRRLHYQFFKLPSAAAIPQPPRGSAKPLLAATHPAR